ncbi:bifunctional 4-hydroxy-2-oxoglutarate aldolase/2-dehydro-3-deoxy-phosphogluconate aldolase [Mitsuaria sp. WAJ17]|uniref:bifunctional 4-hydroxy-2-oxoglutarate aldolase/2-dehydro-3-deoxy-phosphogluconate aldolase n=1 Tax=Mitsuaria sp. WAJ17 TaxID=2761452 RepID=UPI0016013B3B|nr:bifunctional 4-hydroxy-2-oxoglutarate aldolase/2-dehydro-3-deoxy-phosphogluconate aldolase [Mitsuaria sp. WAJ17]MBB2486323.1 bifunctional 4-hydroxy-2-oxoglutarate aldolase/2-dehydro-3-deoxy-phosphogluconate aldolase [Mitsuaria sp. WAJ17]
MSNQTLSLASHGPVIPVIVIQKLEHAVPLAEALVAGGVRVLEVTLRTPVALQAMEAMARAVPEAIVGAGTLRTAADVAAAKNAGCRFGVSPGFSTEIAVAAQGQDLALLPGVSTASEVMQANSAGYTFLKLFPAVAVGGVNLLKALAGPFPDIAFCPTGGITQESAPQFLSLPNVKVCGGSWLTPQDAMDAGDWARITQLARATHALRA